MASSATYFAGVANPLRIEPSGAGGTGFFNPAGVRLRKVLAQIFEAMSIKASVKNCAKTETLGDTQGSTKLIAARFFVGLLFFRPTKNLEVAIVKKNVVTASNMTKAFFL